MTSKEALHYVRTVLGHSWVSRPRWYRLLISHPHELGARRMFAPLRKAGTRTRGGNFIFTSKAGLNSFPWIQQNKGK